MRHLVLSPSPAAASNVPSISDGCIEVPKSIAFADNKKWQLKKVIAEPSGQGAMSAMLSKVKVRYEAQVTVDCNCGNPPPLLSVSGTRVWENEIEVAFGSEVFLATNNPFPYEISTPISGMAGIGELIAEAIKEALQPISLPMNLKRWLIKLSKATSRKMREKASGRMTKTHAAT